MTSMLSRATNKAPSLPTRSVFYAAEKTGKTSFGCHSLDPFFIMTAGETGLVTLLESGQVPPTDHYPDDLREWPMLTRIVHELKVEKHDRKNLWIDTGNGAENMLIKHVTANNFGGRKAKFLEYGKGMDLCTSLWSEFLAALDDLRLNRGMSINFLYHAKAKTFKDPAGTDFDQWRPEAQEKLWALTHKWSDVICYYGIKAEINEETEKATGKGQRFLQCSNTPAIVAGNRYGLPEQITANGAKGMYEAFNAALTKCKGKTPAAPTHQPTTPPATPTKPPANGNGNHPTPQQPVEVYTLEKMIARFESEKIETSEELGLWITRIVEKLPTVAAITADKIDLVEAIRQEVAIGDETPTESVWLKWAPEAVPCGKAIALTWLRGVKSK